MSYFSSPFPQEIIDSVVEELSSDRDSLKQCALVSRCQFLQPARRHLFSDIKLHKPLHCQRLLTVLKSNPEITRHIRHLILSNLRLQLLVQSEEATVATLLTLVQSLRSLSLSYIFWDTLPIELRSTLYALLRSPSLKKLSFIGVHDFPLEDLSSFTQLESLYLSAMDGMRRRSYPETPPFENPKEIGGQLKSLEIGMGSIRSAKSILTVLGHPSSKLSYSQLTELSIEVVNPETLDIFHSLMKAAGSSLKSFSSKLDFSRWPGAYLIVRTRFHIVISSSSTRGNQLHAPPRIISLTSRMLLQIRRRPPLVAHPRARKLYGGQRPAEPLHPPRPLLGLGLHPALRPRATAPGQAHQSRVAVSRRASHRRSVPEPPKRDDGYFWKCQSETAPFELEQRRRCQGTSGDRLFLGSAEEDAVASGPGNTFRGAS